MTNKPKVDWNARAREWKAGVPDIGEFGYLLIDAGRDETARADSAERVWKAAETHVTELEKQVERLRTEVSIQTMRADAAEDGEMKATELIGHLEQQIYGLEHGARVTPTPLPPSLAAAVKEAHESADMAIMNANNHDVPGEALDIAVVAAHAAIDRLAALVQGHAQNCNCEGERPGYRDPRCAAMVQPGDAQ